ncbi:806_t:CDS:2 [Paraglomus occultum]|uniref:806_t:CDS:1 n=1 Tax=Paraglomus occultum TaxID=144539 RepID=A0A9N9CTX8_9GLOM|nr:806_t:CDS:2 [Paraglomus occultum]
MNAYIDIEEYLQNIEKNVEEYCYGFSEEEHVNNRVLNNHDDMDIDWSEEFGSVSEPLSMIQDEQEIEEVSMPNATTACVIIDTIQGEIRRCNGTAELRPLKQLAETWEIDNNAVEEAKNKSHRLGLLISRLTDNREITRNDLTREWPEWPYTVYAPNKEMSNIITGVDISPDEAKPRVSAGRRKRNIAYYTYAKLVEMKKTKSKGIRQKAISKSVERSSEQTRRPTTEIEKAILAPLLEIDDNELLETKIQEVLLQLPTWTRGGAKQYVRNNSRQKKTGQQS